MRTKTILLTSSANVGLGFWTSICLGFARFFGVKSKNYNKKLNTVIDLVKQDLKRQMEQYPNYTFSDFRIVKDGSLAYTASVIGVGEAPDVEEMVKTLNEEEIKPVEIEEVALNEEMCEKITDKGNYLFNVEKDYNQAFLHWEKASAHSLRAKFNLGFLCYYRGNGIKKDREKGIELIREAAKGGHAKAIEFMKEHKRKID